MQYSKYQFFSRIIISLHHRSSLNVIIAPFFCYNEAVPLYHIICSTDHNKKNIHYCLNQNREGTTEYQRQLSFHGEAGISDLY